MKVLNILQVVMWVTLFANAQDIGRNRQYQIPYDLPGLSVNDTVPFFHLNDYNGWFVCCINVLKSGKVDSFDIVRLELCNDSMSYSYREGVRTRYQSRKEHEYPSLIRKVYPAIDSLITNRLCIHIKDTSQIHTDTIFVIWGRSIGTER